MAFVIDYKLTVRKPDDVTTLTPRAGAPHSDPFTVATASDFGASQAYLAFPMGRRGKLDLLKGITDTGGVSLRILDAKVGATGGNAERWVTAFVGDPENISQMIGLKVLIEERVSDDGAAPVTADWFTGRIEDISVGPKKNEVTLKLRDMADDLNYTIFTGVMVGSDLNTFINPVPAMNSAAAAFVDYGSRPALAPVGLVDRDNHEGGVAGYGGFVTTAWMPGTWNSSDETVDLDEGETRAALRMVHDGWPIRGTGIRGQRNIYNRNPDLRVRVRRPDGQFGDFTWGTWDDAHNNVGGIFGGIFGGRSASVVFRVPLDDLASVDVNHQAKSTWLTNGDAVHCYVYSVADPTKAAPIYVHEKHPAQFLADIFDGKWGSLNLDGTVRRSFPRDTASFTTLIADLRIPESRWVIEKPAKLNEWIEKNICVPYQIGYRINGSGEVVVFSTRRPEAATVSGVPTIGVADLVAKTTSKWSQIRGGVINVVTYKTKSETGPQISELTGMDSVLAQIIENVGGIDPADLLPVAEREHQITYLLADNDALKTKGVKKHTVKLTGIKTGFRPATSVLGITLIPESLARSWSEIHKSTIEAFFNFGPIKYKATVRRTANTIGCFPGDWRKLQIPEQIDPANVKRGGLRVGMCLERTERDALTLDLTFIDGGPNTVATGPTLNALVAGPDPRHEVRVSIDLTAFSVPTRHAVEFAVTETSVGTRPIETSILWLRAHTTEGFGGTVTTIIRDLPACKRVWVRVRIEPASTEQLPSAWAFPPTTDRIDTTCLTAPTALVGTANGAGIHVLNWTVGEVDEEIAINVKESACASGTFERIRVLIEGTEKFVFAGLTVSTTYCVGVSHVDRFGGESTKTTLEFTTGASKNVAPVMADVSVVFEGE